MLPNERLRNLAELFEERNAHYGDDYTRFGHRMKSFFPGGVTLSSEEDFCRFGVLCFMVSKFSRYANNFATGGHSDSLHDLAVYSAMLDELDLRASAKIAEATDTGLAPVGAAMSEEELMLRLAGEDDA